MKQLIAYAEKYAKEQSAISVELITASHRGRSGTHAFYYQLGYNDHAKLDYSYFSKEIIYGSSCNNSKNNTDDQMGPTHISNNILKSKL